MYLSSTRTHVRNVTILHWEKNAIESIAFLSKSMYITDSNQYDIGLVTYLLVLVLYFYKFIVYMLLGRNAFDSIVFFLLSVQSTLWCYCITLRARASPSLSHFPLLTVTLRATRRSTIKCYFTAAPQANKERLFCLFQMKYRMYHSSKVARTVNSASSKMSTLC